MHGLKEIDLELLLDLLNKLNSKQLLYLKNEVIPELIKNAIKLENLKVRINELFKTDRRE